MSSVPFIGQNRKVKTNQGGSYLQARRFRLPRQESGCAEAEALDKEMSDRLLPIIGWREWISLPELGIAKIKAKIDTGARSSALHAFDIQTFELDGKSRVRFQVHPEQRSTIETVTAEAEVIDWRKVRNSGGKAELRPVVLTEVELMGKRWEIEVTLTNRELMGFRMLLGRQAVRRQFLIDAEKSYLISNE